MKIRLMDTLVPVALLLIAFCPTAQAQHVNVEVFTLDNGMKFLLVPRTDQPNSIAAGWVAKVGSVNERPGITGISHFFEHMMFKGTNTIGTRDAKADAEFRAKEQAVHEKILSLVWTGQYKRFKAGEIDDPWNPKNDTDELKKLRAELKTLIDEHGKIIKKNEFDQIYTKAGATGMNAGTANDITLYFINVPSNKFELWAWMESDRLSDSVFREFYSERDVVHEERRLRTESTPTGIFQEQFDAMFWQSSPYSWPVIGWTSDLNSYTRAEADNYFNIYYRPNNLIGVIVGDFDPGAVKSTIQEYFGRLKRGEKEPPPVTTLEMAQNGEQRMTAECDCQPQIEIRYHTVPFAHADSYALEMLANLMNDDTGRLYKSMIEGKKIASSASTNVSNLSGPNKYAGSFSFSAEVKGDAKPEMLEAAWDEEIAKLQTEPVPVRELQKVKNQIAANAYRRLQNNFFLMLQLGYYECMGDWEYINTSSAKLQAVNAGDIKRVAKTYFDPKNRSVGLYYRKAAQEGSTDDPELAKLEPQQQGIAKMMLAKMVEYDLAGLQDATVKLQESVSKAPPQFTPMLNYVLKKAEARIAELQAAPKKN